MLAPGRTKGWLRLGAGLVALGLGIWLVAWASPRLPGAAGRTFAHNLQANIRPSALFYTEVGDLAEFLEPGGRYHMDDASKR